MIHLFNSIRYEKYKIKSVGYDSRMLATPQYFGATGDNLQSKRGTSTRLARNGWLGAISQFFYGSRQKKNER